MPKGDEAESVTRPPVHHVDQRLPSDVAAQVLDQRSKQGDRIAIDVEGVKLLQQWPRNNQVQMPVWEIPLIQRAVEMGLGAANEGEYRVIAG